jgi:hypothetical protein
MIQSVFVIAPEKDNACIFYGQLDQTPGSEVDDLGNILGSIVDYAQNLSEAQIKNIQLSQGKFAYGKFGKIYLILKIQKTDDFDEIKVVLQKMAEGFLAEYKNKLSSFDGDTSLFDGFTDKIQSYLSQKAPVEDKKGQLSGQPAISTPEKLAKSAVLPKKSAELDEFSSEEEEEIEEEAPSAPIKSQVEVKEQAPKSGRILLQTAKPIEYVPEKLPEEETLSAEKPILAPDKRDAYANGIDEYMRDEVLWNESQAVMKEYTADFVEGVIAKLQIFLSISIVHHYELVIDFENYPEKPIVEMSEGLTKELGPIESVSYFFKHWDPKIPPHIIEIVRELEKILMKLKSSGKLEATMEMPETALPELKPLEKLPYRPFEKPVVIKQKEAPKAPQAEISDDEKESEQELSEIPKAKSSKPQTVAVKKEEKTPAKKEPELNEKEKKKLEEKKQKDLEKEKKINEMIEAEKKKQEEKEREKQEKLEKKDGKKKMKEILKEGEEEAKKEMKSGF